MGGNEPARRGRRNALLGRGRGDADHAPAPALAELDRAGGGGEDRVVPADADAQARLELGPALAHDDLAAGHGLTGEDLHAEALGVGVAAVAAGAEALLVCHYSVSPSFLAFAREPPDTFSAVTSMRVSS